MLEPAVCLDVARSGGHVRARMVQARRRWISMGMSLLAPMVAEAALATQPVQSAPARPAATLPRLFLNCAEECFGDYLRQELNYFDFVRDPHLPDVLTLLIVRQPSGNGGERFSVSLHPSAEVDPAAALTGAGEVVVRSFVGAPEATQHALRQELRQQVLHTLQAELMGTPHEGSFELHLPSRAAASLDAVDDPWDFWVLVPEVRASTEGQSGHYYAELTSTLSSWRITEHSKLRLSLSHASSVTGFRLEDVRG
jgi:hypothetical protein